MWLRRGEAASARLSAAPYFAHHDLYSEAVVSTVASAVALAETGQFKEAVEYVQKAAKALNEAAREVFEKVKVTVQRLVELFVEAVARVLSWIDEHKAYLFLMAAVAAGVIALSTALNLWGLVEMEKLAYAASLSPFIPGGVKEYSREEAFKILREAPDPYEKFKEIARDANAGRIKLAEPWESLRVLIMPKRSEEKRLIHSKIYSKLDEGKKKGLFYAALALEEAFSVYRTALREVVEGLREAVEKREVGEGPFKRVGYMADLGLLTQLAAEESRAFEGALRVLGERLNEYTVKYGLRDLLGVNEYMARRLAKAKAPELSEFGGVSFGVKALAALIAYREYALGRGGAFGAAAWHWLEVGGSAWLVYYTPRTAHSEAERARAKRPTAVEEMLAEALRRLFLKPGADRYRDFVELLRSGELALMLGKKAKSKKTESYVFKLYRIEEGGGLVDLGIKLWIAKVGEGEGITYTLIFSMKSWRGFFGQELETAKKAAEEIGGRLPVEDRLPYMLGWVDSDVAISRRRNERVLRMTTSYLWQLAETHALFGWSVVGLRITLTLEGPKLAVAVEAPLERLDEVVRKSAEGGWLHMPGNKEGLEDIKHVKSWDELKRWVAGHWDVVVDAAARRLGEVLTVEELEKLLAPEGGDVAKRRKGRQVAPRDKEKDGENVWEVLRRRLHALRDRLNDDKVAREVVAPALLLIQAERLGVNETTLKYFAAVISGAVGGDGHVSAAIKIIELASGKREIALLWAAALAAYGIKAEVRRVGSVFHVVASSGDAARLAGLYFLYGPPLLEGDERLINHKLAEAVKLAAERLSVSWEGLRQTKSGAAADLIISEAGIAVKYNIYLRNKVELEFQSSDRSRVELAARMLRLAGVSAEVKKEGGRDKWYVVATTDRLAAGHKRLRKALAEIIKTAIKNGWIDARKAGGWLEKLERGLTLKEGWPKYKVRLSSSGALEVKFSSTNPDSIAREAQRLKEMGLEEGRHFTVKMPEGGKAGYVYIRREGLERATLLSVHGSGRQRELATDFVEYILQRAKEEGKEVYGKAKEIVEEGMSRGSLRLRGFEGRVEMGGKEHIVKVIDGGAEIETSKSGKLLLRIKITAEVDGVRSEYEITYGRYGKNEARGRAYASAEAPGGRKDDAGRFSALIKALTGEEPKVYRMKNGKIIIECYEGHLEGFMRYAELADAIKKWSRGDGSASPAHGPVAEGASQLSPLRSHRRTCPRQVGKPRHA